MSSIIFEIGCIQAGEKCVEENLILISTIIILCIFFQVNLKLFLLANFLDRFIETIN